MAKIKFTKGELKRQRDSLQQFQHYLPTLQLKKQQLQMKILEIRRILQEKQGELEKFSVSADKWVGVLADPRINPGMEKTEKDEADKRVCIKDFIKPKKISLGSENIAGSDIPIFEGIDFENIEYDFYSAPFWLYEGIEKLRKLIALIAEVGVLEKQVNILKEELRVTTQRVNLFEKVKIPECIENIRRIRIYLGDIQATAVGIGKVAKKKVELTLAV